MTRVTFTVKQQTFTVSDVWCQNSVGLLRSVFLASSCPIPIFFLHMSDAAIRFILISTLRINRPIRVYARAN